jgi:glycosyltransferase involved in cell wall biosynthesis
MKLRMINADTIILNFLTIGAGGGLQNSLSLLEGLAQDRIEKKSCLAIVKESSQVQDTCIKYSIPHIPVPASLSGRLLAELTYPRKFLKGQTCFTLFGPPMLRSTGYLMNIVGCAYSNLLYPDLNFWAHLKGKARLKAELVDLYRRRGMTLADYWIFETDTLAQRAIQHCGVSKDRVGVVRMAVSRLVVPSKIMEHRKQDYLTQLSKGFPFLFLCSDNPNKRLHLLPFIAQEMIKMGVGNFCFVTTLDETSKYARELLSSFDSYGISSYLVNIGTVRPDDVASLIDSCGAMCTFSLLESFSNNFVEAWSMQKPLLVTAADWAEDSCGEAALYVKPENPQECASHMARIVRDAKLRQQLVREGSQQLSRYPTPEEKVTAYFEQIHKAVVLGPLGIAERRKLRWMAPSEVDRNA